MSKIDDLLKTLAETSQSIKENLGCANSWHIPVDYTIYYWKLNNDEIKWTDDKQVLTNSNLIDHFSAEIRSQIYQNETHIAVLLDHCDGEGKEFAIFDKIKEIK